VSQRSIKITYPGFETTEGVVRQGENDRITAS
jgi:hypothetical protein